MPILDVGMPSISSEEREAISAIAHQGLKASIGVSIRLKRDEVDQASECDVKEVFIICPVSPLHVRSKLGLDEEGVKRLMGDVIRYADQKGFLINLAAEDAARAEIPFLCEILSLRLPPGSPTGLYLRHGGRDGTLQDEGPGQESERPNSTGDGDWASIVTMTSAWPQPTPWLP